MKSYKERAANIESGIQELARFSNEKENISRIFGTKAFIDCRDKIESRMKDAGLLTSVDNIGNLRGRLLSQNIDAKTFVIGSHFDTIPNSGKYDGVLGILAGLDILERLITGNIQLPFHIELIAFSDTHGVRFDAAFLGSKTVTGTLNTDILKYKDRTGASLEEILGNLNYDSANLLQDAIPAKKWLGYFEIHIEQAPVLYKNNISAGIATGFAGHKRIQIEFRGVAGHAGNVPMKARKDALVAASEFITGVEKFASSKKSNIVATVGKLNVQYAASNVIPAKVSCSLEFRSNNKKKLSKAYEGLNELCEDVCNKRKVYFDWRLIQETNPVSCDEKLTRLLRKSIKETNSEVVELETNSVHDAAIVAQVAPVCVLLVKCFKGIGHSPLENVEVKDIAAALEVSDNFINQLIQQ